MYLVPFLRYSTSNNGVTFNSGRGRSRSLKMAPFDNHIRLTIGLPSQAARQRQHCLNGDRPSIWEWRIFCPLQSKPL